MLPSVITPSPSARVAGSEINVVSIPAGHPYIRAVTSAPGVRVLADPPHPAAPQGQWWPPAALDPGWIRSHGHEADLLHIHFGTESFSPEHLAACVDTAHDVGWPVVFTVHDIWHPQLDDQAPYLAQLDVLIPAADSVLTLTRGAADEIRRRWHRDATVVEHPALLDSTELSATETSSMRVDPFSFRVGLHLKDLRTNIAAVPMVTALARALDQLHGEGLPVVAEVRMHHAVRDEPGRDRVRALCATSPHIELIEHDRLSDPQLVSALARLDAGVLPYSHGTHSGWLELCWDLAIPLAVPRVGFYADQHAGDNAAFDADPEGTSLAAALLNLTAAPTATRAETPERAHEITRRRAVRAARDGRVAAVHAALYRDLVGRVRS
jgi:hypothetical protein